MTSLKKAPINLADILKNERESRERFYECVLMTTDSSGDVDHALSDITAELKDKRFNVIHQENWNSRHLEYQIKKRLKAHYTIIYFSADPSVILNLKARLRLNPGVLRALILRVDRISVSPAPIARENSRESLIVSGGRARYTPVTSKEASETSQEQDNSEEDSSAFDYSYKNPAVLAKFMNELARIKPRQATDLSAKLQRKVRRQVNLARFLGILPFSPGRRRIS